MAKYAYKDVIIDPTSEEAKNCIGKYVYFADNPSACLRHANYSCNNYCLILREIKTDKCFPFVLGNQGTGCACIILKKEEPKHEYVPFSNQEEFLNHYVHHKDRLVESSSIHQLSSLGGVWLKDKHLTTFYMVTEIWDDGVIIGDTKMKTAKRGNGEYFTMNDITKWCELLEDYTFLDGTPCGRDAETL